MNDDVTKRDFSAEEISPHIGTRLDVFLAEVMGRSRSRAQTMLKSGAVKLAPASARAQASYKLRAGDSVVIEEEAIAPADESAPQGEDIALDILFEDKTLLVLNKQPGLVVHPAAGHRTGTLVNALVHHLGDKLAGRGGEQRLGLVHRLDQDTSGVILIAKTDAAHEKLAAAFASREVRKFYRALCWGKFRRNSGSIKDPIGRHRVHRQKMAVVKMGGKDSHTDYRVLAQGVNGAEVECELHTGRTHQIRVHLAHLGHPVWGDKVYSRTHHVAGFAPARQMLHAARMEIIHPVSGKVMKFEAEAPEDFLAARSILLAT